MGDLSEFTFTVRTFLRLYRWRRIDPIPWAPLSKPLAEAQVALVSTAGFVLPDQQPFDHAVKGGDTSFRTIPSDADLGSLIDCHRSETYDHGGVDGDPNLGLPIDRLRELAAAGIVGSANRRHLSFMGSITAPGRLIAQSAPQAAEILAADGVDAALLVPV
jgi:D-proline reductase (dithiol) PrdB